MLVADRLKEHQRLTCVLACSFKGDFFLTSRCYPPEDQNDDEE